VGFIEEASIVEAFLRASGPKVPARSAPSVSGFQSK